MSLHIDSEALGAAQSTYEKMADDMEKLMGVLSKSVDGLREGWQSEAGTEFFTKFDDQWKSNFNDYINVIRHMSNNMQTATTKYQEVFDEADAINL